MMASGSVFPLGTTTVATSAADGAGNTGAGSVKVTVVPPPSTAGAHVTGEGSLVEVQATAEQEPFSRGRLDELLELAALGIERIAEAQEEAAAARV